MMKRVEYKCKKCGKEFVWYRELWTDACDGLNTAVAKHMAEEHPTLFCRLKASLKAWWRK